MAACGNFKLGAASGNPSTVPQITNEKLVEQVTVKKQAADSHPAYLAAHPGIGATVCIGQV